MGKKVKQSVLGASLVILMVTGIAAAGGLIAAQLVQRIKPINGVGEPPALSEKSMLLPAGVVAMSIPTVLTYLAGDSHAWIRAEFVVLLAGVRPSEALAAAIGNDTVAYLRTVTPAQLSGPNGFAYLREDIAERVQIRTSGGSRGILFKTFVVE